MSGRRRRAAIVILLCAAPIVLLGLGLATGLRLNLTPSYAIGLWRIVPLDRAPAVGDLIFICPPEGSPFFAALERGYMRPGLCPGWISPLIKTVAAVAGQHVQIGRAVAIDGVSLPHSTISATDAEGRPLTPTASGIVPPGHLFLHSDFRGSYDSRYFGPIPADGTLGLARPVLTFAP